jgi:PadR family transcriptional regulator PadR
VTTVNPELPRGTLHLRLLQVVALGPIHGYAIAQRVQLLSRDVLPVRHGSRDPALNRLEPRGWLPSAWRASDRGRDAKLCRLTHKGRTHLKEETDSWGRLSDAIGLMLRTAIEGGAL